MSFGAGMPISVSRPDPAEYAPFFAGYVSRVSGVDDATALLERQRDQIVALLSPLSESAAAHRYAPGKWSIKELVGHISDAERIFSYRLLRVGRDDATPLAGFDENDYVRASHADERPLAALLEEWRAVRQATIALVAGLPADAWPRRGTSNGELITARALLYIIIGHVEHHRHVLIERYGAAL